MISTQKDTISITKEDNFDSLSLSQGNESRKFFLIRIIKLFHSKTKGIFWYALLAYSIWLYILNNERCPYESDVPCLSFLYVNVDKWILWTFIDSILFLFMLIFFIKTKKIILTALTISSLVYCCYYYNFKLSLMNYGQGISILLQIFIVIELLVILFLLIARSFIRRKAYIPLAVIILIIAVFVQQTLDQSCKDWEYGLAGEKIEDIEGTCKVPDLDFCFYEVSANVLDFAQYEKECSEIGTKNFKQDIFEEFYPPTNYVGFPRTQKLRNRGYYLQSSVFKHLIPLQNLSDPRADNLEIFLNKTDPKNIQMIIDVKRDEAIVEDRALIDSEPLVSNVLMIFIDALSRANSIRKLKKTMKWFEKYMNNPESDKETYQFFKYHAYGGFTHPNLYQIFYGMKYAYNDGKNLKRPGILDAFKDNGFITGTSSDLCCPDIPISSTNEFEMILDHEGFAFACDPSYYDSEDLVNMFNGPYSVLKKCLYGKNIHEYNIDYADQFWRKYHDQKKLFKVSFMDAHEASGEYVKYIDDSLYEFLSNLEKDGLLENTMVMFYSDHGLHMTSHLEKLGIYQVAIEKFLPALYLNVPKKNFAPYDENLKKNKQKLVYSKDLFHTLGAVAEGHDSQHLKYSILANLTSRVCDDINYLDTIEVCACL